MANDEPPYLNVGTDVSAKYKGAFCEAKIKKVSRVVKCKVTFKNSLGSFMVTDDLIKGPLRMGADIEAKHPEKNQFLEAIINKLQDYSQYTVVFDDGDETTLRRTSLCLKSGRHFAESPTLDQFPLTNPEHFGTPVIGAGKYKRKRRSTMNSSIDYESSDDDSFPRKLKAMRGKEKDPDLGKVVAVDYGDRRKKDSWYPGLIVPQSPSQSNNKISKEEHLIRSFKDGKYYQVPKRDTREFIKDNIPKIENNVLKTAVDKAILYLEKGELPTHWDKALFMGLDLPSADEDSQDSDTDSSDDEPSEDKDRFVAQLYKFMDERGTPINKAPAVSNRDLNLYKLFKIMHKLGGFNKVTNQNKWKNVYQKMGLPASNANGPNQIKCAYKRYLQSFEDFYRKLGCTMVNNSRSTRGRHRSDRNFILTRTRDRETSSPKGRNTKDTKDKATTEKKTEEKPRASEKKEIKTEDSPKKDKDEEKDKPKSPEKKKVEKTPRLDDKDEKRKKDERPRLVRSQSLNKDKKDISSKEEDKKEVKPEKARTREDARKEKTESPEKKGTRSSLKLENEKKEKEEAQKDKKDQSPKGKDKKEEKPKDIKEEKPKEKKEEKIVKDRKIVKDKKVDEKVGKDKVEDLPKEKDEKPVREKRDSSKEHKDEKPKGRKEDVKPEEKSPVKKKLDRLVKEKKDEKICRPRRENKSPLPEHKKSEDIDLKKVKEEKPKSDVEVKKEDSLSKDKAGPRLRERRDDIPLSEDEHDKVEIYITNEKDTISQDGFEKKVPGPRSHDEPPNKGKKKSLKSSDKEDKDNDDMLSDSDDETYGSEHDKDYKDLKSCEIELGDRVKVKYGRGRLKKVYDAKVLKIQTDGTEKRYYVHYNGWNNRYDEWVRRNFIVALVNPSKISKDNPKSPFQGTKKIDKGRPPGPIVPSKPCRKNSTSSTNSSVSCSRATRSEKKALQNSPLSGGLEPKKRTRRKSGLTGLTDTSQDSESDAEETVDDEDNGDADVEDNANTQNDSCFKEELFSDDEEKEKMEDVKRDDITELEKAIPVDETAEDAKDLLFATVKIDTIKIEIPVKEENMPVQKTLKDTKEEASIKVSEKEDIPEVKAESVKIEASPSVEKTVPVKTLDKELKVPAPEKVPEIEKKPVSEVPVIASTSKNIIKPAKITNLTGSPEPKLEKNIFSPIPPKITSSLMSDQNKEFLKSSFTQNPLSMPENRNALSFAGLQGLIQISSFDMNSSLHRNVTKEATPTKTEPSKSTLNSTPPKIDLKPEVEIKNLASSLFRPDKMMPVFGSNCIMSPPKLTEPAKRDEKPLHKGNQGVFSFIVKGKGNEEKAKELKPFESPFKMLSKEASKDKPDLKNEDIQKLKTPEMAEKKTVMSTVSDPTSFKHCIISPAKFCAIKSDSVEPKPEKPKDTFDFLVESSKLSEPKRTEVKDNIFSLSFPSISPKENFISDQPYNKSLAMSAENLCCIKPKPSETFDLSKTIPSIIERLKKDVVADLKVTDSPPPQKEELNFNFLRSSQDTAKSLSRSESSNSLRICEDMSDTNDSNTDSKDLTISGKIDLPCEVTSNSACDNAVPCPSENLVKQPEALKTECTEQDSTSSASNISEKMNDSRNSFKTSVITVASTKSSPIASVVLPEVKKDNKDSTLLESTPASTKPESFEKKVEPTVKSDEVPKIVPVLEIKESNSQVEQLPPKEESKDLKPESATISNNEPANTSKNEKDSLFDDLLKIKNTNTNISQNSVIMWNLDTKSSVSVDEKSKVISEDEEVKKVMDVSIPVDQKDEPLTCKNSVASKNDNVESQMLEKTDDDIDSSTVNEIKSDLEDNEPPEEDSSFSLMSKKEPKKKKLGKRFKKFGLDGEDREAKNKEGKSKSKKRQQRLENEDSEKIKDPDFKSKSKKIKKNKNKKRLAKHDDLLGELKKGDTEDDHKDISEKLKRKEKRKNDKKFLKSGMKGDFESRMELKKKKGKKNRDKLCGDKKDFMEKKTKKKKKPHFEDNQDTDSEKESNHKTLDKKKKKDRKKFKAKDSSSSDDANDKYFKEQTKILNLPSSSALMRQDSKSDDPDMSFLLCEEKVPASPVGMGNMADDTSGSSSIEDNNRLNSSIDILPLPNIYPCMDNVESSDTMNKHSIDTSAVLDNTPPTTPSSTESLLSSSPSHERDSFSVNYPESTQSGRDSGEGESDLYRVNANRTISRGSDEYHAATTLAFAVCKTPVQDKPKEEVPHSFLKRQKSEIEEHSPSKRKKKSKRVRRCSESAKSPRHKPSLSRIPKVESCCEDSSGTSPAASSSPPYSSTSTMSFSRSPHRMMPCSTEGFPRYNFYVPLHEKDPEKRIALLQEKMAALRKEYMELRAKVIAIDHKRRRARKKIREAGTTNANPSVQSEDGHSCS